MIKAVYNKAIERLTFLSSRSDDLKEWAASSVLGTLDFLKWSESVSVATTCLYQHIFGEEHSDDEEIICYFPMLASISLRLKPWLVHSFFASKISHW